LWGRRLRLGEHGLQVADRFAFIEHLMLQKGRPSRMKKISSVSWQCIGI